MSRRRARSVLADLVAMDRAYRAAEAIDAVVRQLERPGEQLLREGLEAVCEETAPVMVRMGKA